MSERPGAHGIEASKARGHELRDLSSRTLVVGMAALGLVTLIAAAAMAGLLGWFEARDAVRRGERSPLVEVDVRPPAPQLEIEPGQVLDRLRALESIQLEGWAWLDQQAGIARIPIDRAMEILAARGLPHRSVADASEGER